MGGATFRLATLALGSVAASLNGLAAPGRGAWPLPQEPGEPRPGSVQSLPSSGQRTPTRPVPRSYTPPPERRTKGIAYARARYTLYFVGVALSLGIYFLLWRARVGVAFRNWGRRISPRHFAQCLFFVPLFVLVVSALQFPYDYIADFVLEHHFDLSTQTFGSWVGDWAKAFAVSVIFGVFLAWIFYGVVRRSPRRWWFYFWLATIPLALGLMLIEPYVIEPLFYTFTRLEKTRPVLTTRIQAMLRHAELEIPSSRIFEMNASTKTRTANAYVSGLGVSQRVVVWDTTLKKLDEDETLLTLGHEAGHYVLHHALKEFYFDELVALVLFFLASVALRRLVGRLGVKTGLEDVGDLASFPLVLFVVTFFAFLSSPLFCGISRYYEHQADQFGIEAAYGVVPDPNAAEARCLEVLGEEDLADPDPNPFIKFWLYTHPPLDERIQFAASYRPWVEGKPLQLVHPEYR